MAIIAHIMPRCLSQRMMAAACLMVAVVGKLCSSTHINMTNFCIEPDTIVLVLLHTIIIIIITTPMTMLPVWLAGLVPGAARCDVLCL